MPQDFAKRHSTPADERPAPRFVWFVTGFMAGVFCAFLLYLWQDIPTDPEIASIPKPADKPAQVEEMQWDFYEIFPKSEVPIIEEYTDSGAKVETTRDFRYILQTGSFKNPSDADELRARLLLMGLDVFVKEVDVNGSQWHRVIVGPLDNGLALNRAQDKLAQAEIASIPFRVNRP
jgi:cell division protein FtsN